ETWQAIIHPDDQKMFAEFMRQTLVEGREGSLECRSNIHEGKMRWIQVFTKPLKGPDGRVQTVIGAVKDISARKQAEAALRESEARLLAFMEYVPALILIKDHEFRPVYANRRFQQVHPFEEWRGKTPHETFPAEVADPMVEKDRQVMEQGSITYDESWPGRDGRVRHYRTTKFRIEVPGHSPLLGAIIVDITEQRTAESEREKLRDQLLQAQKMESVGRLAGGVAHDFNNMLQAILGYTEIALGRSGLDPGLRADLEQIQKTANRSADLTRQLLTFARKQTVAPRVLDLNETIAGTLGMLRRLIGEDIELHWLPDQSLGSVRIDPTQIDQVLANLCVNARDAITGAGRITIATTNVDLDEAFAVRHSDCPPGAYVAITFSDSGHGMDHEVMAHLFEPFFTTKGIGRGTGLGLATVFGIVTQNGGAIDAESEPGRGTTFRIYLPRHAEAPAPRDIPSQGSYQAGQETILLVEDELAILNMGRLMLEKMGYRVLAAATPGEALHLAEGFAERIDLLLTDVVLPEMNGRELALRILVPHPEVKRLFMSGYTAEVIAPQGVLAPEVHFIQKPFTFSELAARVREALGPD
ncbi:MAG TPA: PAS domain-containing protein, partial [Candidatus Aminicenantes bacterium]|nr:PAS domain-containing protein [Candidatus Aminicenantes bacterium]